MIRLGPTRAVGANRTVIWLQPEQLERIEQSFGLNWNGWSKSNRHFGFNWGGWGKSNSHLTIFTEEGAKNGC
jgi:hypothetical protein